MSEAQTAQIKQRVVDVGKQLGRIPTEDELVQLSDISRTQLEAIGRYSEFIRSIELPMALVEKELARDGSPWWSEDTRLRRTIPDRDALDTIIKTVAKNTEGELTARRFKSLTGLSGDEYKEEYGKWSLALASNGLSDRMSTIRLHHHILPDKDALDTIVQYAANQIGEDNFTHEAFTSETSIRSYNWEPYYDSWTELRSANGFEVANQKYDKDDVQDGIRETYTDTDRLPSISQLPVTQSALYRYYDSYRDAVRDTLGDGAAKTMSKRRYEKSDVQEAIREHYAAEGNCPTMDQLPMSPSVIYNFYDSYRDAVEDALDEAVAQDIATPTRPTKYDREDVLQAIQDHYDAEGEVPPMAALPMPKSSVYNFYDTYRDAVEDALDEEIAEMVAKPGRRASYGREDVLQAIQDHYDAEGELPRLSDLPMSEKSVYRFYDAFHEAIEDALDGETAEEGRALKREQKQTEKTIQELIQEHYETYHEPPELSDLPVGSDRLLSRYDSLEDAVFDAIGHELIFDELEELAEFYALKPDTIRKMKDIPDARYTEMFGSVEVAIESYRMAQRADE